MFDIPVETACTGETGSPERPAASKRLDACVGIATPGTREGRAKTAGIGAGIGIVVRDFTVMPPALDRDGGRTGENA